MKKLLFLILPALLLAMTLPIDAQVQLVAHPNQDTARMDGTCSPFYEFKGKVYFSARDNIGSALFCTDGTSEGTILVTRDLYPHTFTSCGDWLYIYGSKAQYNIPLWNQFGQYAIWRMRADGSERQKLADLYLPYSMTAYSSFLWSNGERIFFSWREGLSWIDNTTGVVTKVFQGANRESDRLEDFGIQDYAVAQNGLFFIGGNRTTNNFFYTDLTKEGTVALARIKTSGSSIPIDKMRVFNNRCYVLHIADTVQLWSSDGTPGGTSKIWQNTDYFPWDNPSIPVFIENDNQLVFDLPEKVNDTIWHSIYTFSDEGVKLLHRHPIGFRNVFLITNPDGLYVFVKNPKDPDNLEVWLKDDAGYRKVTTLGPPMGSSLISNIKWKDNKFLIPSGNIYVYDDQNFTLQFSTDTPGAALYPTSLGVFFARTENYKILEPWLLKTDPLSCTQVQVLISDLKYGSFDYLTPIGDQLYFVADSKEFGTEVWVTGGQAETTHILPEINTSGNSWPCALTRYANKLVFTAQGDQGYDHMKNYPFSGLWIADGKDNSTEKIEDFLIQEDDHYSKKAVYRDNIYFVGKPKSSSDDAWRLYVSNGQPGEARLFDEQFADLHFTRVYSLTVAGDQLYFVANNQNKSYGLWVTDGTESGTRLIDQYIGDTDYDYSQYFGFGMLAAGSKLYFTRDKFINSHATKMREVWVTDGTAEGTKCIMDSGDDFSKNHYLQFIGTHNGNLVFTYSTPGNGFELWYSGGDRSNTVQLTGQQDTRADNDKQFTAGVALGYQFFFVAFTEENGYELWVTNGTAAGTHIFIELAHGQQSTSPKGLTAVGNKLVFFVEGEGIDFPLWITDGTVEGTEPLPWDFAPLNNFRQTLYWQNALYFVASHPETGQGLYRYDLTGTLGTDAVEKPAKESALTLYPNPATDYLEIALSGQLPVHSTGRLITSGGRIVKDFIIENGSLTIPVTDLPEGIYFVRVGKFNKVFIKD